MKGSKSTVSTGEKGYVSILIDLFRSVKLTIFLLILLAIVSIVGTVITQNATRAEYMRRYGPGLYEVLDFFNLFDMYHSGWFTALLLALVINLIACSLHRFPSAWRQFRGGRGTTVLDDEMIKTLPYLERIPLSKSVSSETEAGISSALQRFFTKPRREDTESAVTFFAEKGQISRLGSYTTHLSLLIILIGGMIGSIYGFNGFVSILEGETVDHFYLREKRGEVPRPIGFSIRCEDFSVSFYDLPGKRMEERHVREYASRLTILENGNPVLSQTVRVNHPLHYRGVTFYQDRYGVVNDVTLGVESKRSQGKTFVKVSEGETVPLPNSTAMLRVLQYAPQIHGVGEGIQVALFEPNQRPRSFWLLRNPSQRNPQGDGDVLLSFEGISAREYTGLQVTKDPGVWIVWLGCGLLIIGLVLSFFFSHQRLWVRLPKSDAQASGGEMLVAGSASKNRIAFERTFRHAVEQLRLLEP